MQTFIFAYSKIQKNVSDVWSVDEGFNCECICPKCDERLTRVKASEDNLYFQHPMLGKPSSCNFGYWQSVEWAAMHMLQPGYPLLLPPLIQNSVEILPAQEQSLIDMELLNGEYFIFQKDDVELEVIFKTPDGLSKKSDVSWQSQRAQLVIDLTDFEKDYPNWWQWGSVFDLLNEIVFKRENNRYWLKHPAVKG